MFRYLAFCWNCRNDDEAQSVLIFTSQLERRADGWKIAFSGPGIRVYIIDERFGASGVIPLQNGCGIILGTLFERSDVLDQQPMRVRMIEADESTRILQTGARRLINAYWGRYVAFIQNTVSHQLWVIRDPTGALPCLTVTIDGVRIYAADIEDCCDLAVSKFSINWRYVRARILIPYLQTGETGLKGVSELLPGSCIELCNGDSRETVYWHPLRMAELAIVEDEAQAVESLRSVVTSTIHAWARCYGSILLKLSGGLDSAIVLGCLSTAPERPTIVCVNDYSQGGDTDERYYAKLAAQRVDCVLIERAREPIGNLERAFTFRRTIAPIPSHVWVHAQPSTDELASRHSAAALFTGNGGDHLFLAGHNHWPLVDYLYCCGPRLHAIRLAWNLCGLEPPARTQSVWSLIRTGVRLGLLGDRRRDPFAEVPDYSDRTTINSEVIKQFASEYRSWLPPWFRSPCDLAPGKLLQAYQLSFAHPYYPSSLAEAGILEPVHPLMSQPVIELCLRIRTYALMTGTTDRTAARKAFSNILPPEIARRRSKGGVNDHAIETLLRNIGFVREFLLDGELARHHMLNKPVLEAALGGKDEGLSIGTFQILDLMHVEAWLRAWAACPERSRSAVSLMEVQAAQH